MSELSALPLLTRPRGLGGDLGLIPGGFMFKFEYWNLVNKSRQT